MHIFFLSARPGVFFSSSSTPIHFHSLASHRASSSFVISHFLAFTYNPFFPFSFSHSLLCVSLCISAFSSSTLFLFCLPFIYCRRLGVHTYFVDPRPLSVRCSSLQLPSWLPTNPPRLHQANHPCCRLPSVDNFRRWARCFPLASGRAICLRITSPLLPIHRHRHRRPSAAVHRNTTKTNHIVLLRHGFRHLLLNRHKFGSKI